MTWTQIIDADACKSLIAEEKSSMNTDNLIFKKSHK